ncbi:hypothetical protein GCM10009790_40090 [Georgenia ruanii]|uniref:hypothetical protein n=1 Tax=Georgenia ruanii TaxID=348442 RepID=UPI0031D6EA13
MSDLHPLTHDPEAQRGGADVYRRVHASITQNERLSVRPLHRSLRARATAVLRGAAHWATEQAPDQLLVALTPFLTPYP